MASTACSTSGSTATTDGALAALLAGLGCSGCGGRDAVQPTEFSNLKDLPATVTGELARTAFSRSAPALGTLARDGESVFVVADLKTLSHAGIRMAFGVEYRGEHTV